MNKILIVGCPGSGKSTLAKTLGKKLNYPILHLDVIFHIDNTQQISRDELKRKIIDFIKKNDNFIIDGNYQGTLEYRMKFADTILFLDFPTEVCLHNVISRTKSNIIRDDIAKGFDNSIIDPDFIEYVTNFSKTKLPKLHSSLANFTGKVIRFRTYQEIETFLDSF